MPPAYIAKNLLDQKQRMNNCHFIKILLHFSGNEELVDEASQDQEQREPQSSAEAKGTKSFNASQKSNGSLLYITKELKLIP